MVFARNTAMAFNRYADRDIDSKNERTASREIPAGIISPRKALWFIAINTFLFILTTASINTLTLALSPLAIAITMSYSLTKRFTWLCHMVLGLSLAIAPTGAYIAVTSSFALFPLLISLLVLCWASGFDIIYALQDEEFDAQNHLYSIPAHLGKKGALIVSFLLHLIAIILIVCIGIIYISHLIYWVGAILFSAILAYEHIVVKPSDISKVNLAFGTLNGLGSVIYAIFTITALFFI